MIWFLTGTNTYALQQEKQAILEEFINKYGADGVEKYDGEALQPNRLPEVLQSISLFTPYRCVLLKDSSQNKPLWDALGVWADKIPDTVWLVITEAQPDKRTKTFKALAKAAEVYIAEELHEGQLAAWLVTEAKTRGNHLNRKDAQLLIGRLGTDQAALSQELDKLIIHPVVNEHLILSLTEASPQASAFELLDAVLAKNPRKAVLIIEALRSREDPYKLFGLLVSQVYSLALIVAAGTRVSAAGVAKDAGIHPYAAGKLTQIAKGVSWPQMDMIIQTVAGYDDAVKSSGADPWLMLETTLMKIATR